MKFEMNRSTLIKVLNNSDFVKEASGVLNEIIDKELDKKDNEIDFDLINECTGALIELKLGVDNPAAIVFPLVSSKNFLSKVGEIGWRSLSRGARAVIVAAAVFAATITASAAVGGITGNTIIENILPPASPETVTEADSVSEKTSENVSSAEVSVTEASSEKEKTNTLRDASIKVKDAEHPEKGYFACYETAGADDVNPKCHYERISFDPDNTIEYPSKFYEKVSDKNTAFNEAEYKKKNCENVVC
ncbi:MAG: hypothetical protein K6C14_04425, partial [Eubacterium sp.]|nr:hypothetical protein [Eubacterium sp.]